MHTHSHTHAHNRRCHLTRDTRKALQAAGFDTSAGLGSFEVEGLGILAPHLAGVLRV